MSRSRIRKPGSLPAHAQLLRTGLLLLAAFGVLYPIFVFLGVSLKSNGEFMTNPLGLPHAYSFSNYVEAWQAAGMGRLILNSLLVSLATVALTIVLASMMAYGLTSFSFRGRGVILASITMMLTIPVQVYIIPLYVISIQLHLVNSRLGLVLPTPQRACRWP